MSSAARETRVADVLGTLPPEIEKEEQQAVALREENVARMALVDPDMVEKRIVARERSLEALRVACVKSTHAYDWTLYKDRDGRVVGVMRDSAASKIRKLMGISIFNYRPTNARGYPEPDVREELQVDGSKVTVVEMTADGLCALTGEQAESVTLALRSDDDFIGRERKDAKGTEFVSLQDMKASCRTGLDTKVTRKLAGLSKVPGEYLKTFGIDLEQSHKGRGFGTSSDRGAARVADEGVVGEAKKLGEEILRRVGGDQDAARALLMEISSWKAKDGKVMRGFDSVARFTQGFQVKNAWDKLKTHPTFGDAAQPSTADREPGADG